MLLIRNHYGAPMSPYATPEQSSAWLRGRLETLGIGGLEGLAELAGTDKGNLSRIFRQRQRPRVDALEPLAAALEVSVYELLVRIGAVDPDREDLPGARRGATGSLVYAWPQEASG